MLIQPKRGEPKGIINNKPSVSIHTITFNRYKCLNILKSHILNQNYPQNLIEWVIIDDSSDEIDKNIIKDSKLNIKYTKLTDRTVIGRKRNIANSKSKGDIIVVMDDDDFYPVNRISHAVEKLQNSKKLIAGSPYLLVFYLLEKELWMSGPGPCGNNYATANTFAFKRKLLKTTRFGNDCNLAEEKEFTKEYTIPMINLDPYNTVFSIAHKSNTSNKQIMRLNPHRSDMKKLNIDEINIDIINQINELYNDAI
tara:strand:+ start:515 stop:1273 length:759 start_codon:yes stop_codon:yes gene_type:complete